MSSTPGGYEAWCAAAGLDMHHPETWPASAHDAFRAWKLDRFRAYWRERMTDQERRRSHATRDARWLLIRTVSEDVALALQRLVRSPWKGCPCHPLLPALNVDELGYAHYPKADPRDVDERVTEDELAAWIAENPTERTFLRTPVAKALTFIERFSPNRRRVAA